MICKIGMTVCENSDSININQKYHNLLLIGSFLSQSEVIQVNQLLRLKNLIRFYYMQ